MLAGGRDEVGKAERCQPDRATAQRMSGQEGKRRAPIGASGGALAAWTTACQTCSATSEILRKHACTTLVPSWQRVATLHIGISTWPCHLLPLHRRSARPSRRLYCFETKPVFAPFSFGDADPPAPATPCLPPVTIDVGSRAGAGATGWTPEGIFGKARLGGGDKRSRRSFRYHHARVSSHDGFRE